jgi:hypothetical protein
VSEHTPKAAFLPPLRTNKRGHCNTHVKTVRRHTSQCLYHEAALLELALHMRHDRCGSIGLCGLQHKCKVCLFVIHRHDTATRMHLTPYMNYDDIISFRHITYPHTTHSICDAALCPRPSRQVPFSAAAVRILDHMMVPGCFSLSVSFTESVADLYEKISAREGVPSAQFTLYQSGKVLGCKNVLRCGCRCNAFG